MSASTTSVVTKATGPSSTSWKIWLATFVTGLASAVTGFVQNTNGIHTTVFSGGGLIVALFATITKLFHDNGLNKGSLAAAGSDIVSALPDLRADIGKVISFAENDFPGASAAIADLEGKYAGLVAKIPDASAIEAIVKEALSAAFHSTTPPAA